MYPAKSIISRPCSFYRRTIWICRGSLRFHGFSGTGSLHAANLRKIHQPYELYSCAGQSVIPSKRIIVCQTQKFISAECILLSDCIFHFLFSVCPAFFYSGALISFMHISLDVKMFFHMQKIWIYDIKGPATIGFFQNGIFVEYFWRKQQLVKSDWRDCCKYSSIYVLRQDFVKFIL